MRPILTRCRVTTARWTVWHVSIPLRRKVRHASHTREHTDSLVAQCVLPSGEVGWGEGLPRDYVTGETVDGALALIQASSFSQSLSANNWFEAIEAAEALRLNPVAGDQRGIAGNAARCALEIAWLDACGRKFGQPLSSIVQRLEPSLAQPIQTVRYSGVITSSKGWKLALLARLYRYTGFRHVKIKVGIEGQNDPARLKLLRRIMGPNRQIRIDANEAWTLEKAVSCLADLKHFGIAWVEQPMPVESDADLEALRTRSGVRVMLDESLCGPLDAEQLVSGKRVDLFNLRLSKCGGFIPTLRLLARARNAGLGAQLGCQVGETGILSAAGRHFAQSVSGLEAVEGSFDRYLVGERLTREDLTFGWGGKAPPLVGPGLGIAVDEAALQRVAVRKVVMGA